MLCPLTVGPGVETTEESQGFLQRSLCSPAFPLSPQHQPVLIQGMGLSKRIGHAVRKRDSLIKGTPRLLPFLPSTQHHTANPEQLDAS